jgi:hypothetical protein
MPSVLTLLTLIGPLIEGFQKGKPFVDDLLALFRNHDVKIRDEAIARMIQEADIAKAEIEAEIAARAARPRLPTS